MSIRFDNRVAIVTGAGNGLGRQYALDLAARGARVVVNDLGGSRDGSGSSATAAEAVVEEIRKAGGEAIASASSVTDADAIFAMVEEVKAKWGRIDMPTDCPAISEPFSTSPSITARRSAPAQ